MNNDLIKIDCTLRDGGYYNNWDFSNSLIKEYLNAIAKTSINFVEIGFRTTLNKGFKGALAFSKDEFLNTLDIPEDIGIGVMVNASDLGSNSEHLKNLKILFPNDAQISPVKLVRLACYSYQIDIALEASKWLVERGFKVGINLMQISEIENNDLINITQKINNYPISVFYFADSLGCLRPNEIVKIVETIKNFSLKSIGIHAHDNLGLAFSNTIIAKENGVKWLDSTISGMGRGPGNCKTEDLLLDLDFKNSKSSEIAPVLFLINKYFSKLREKYKWGTNPYYFLSGKYKIHPSYMQSLINNSLFSDDDKLMIIEKLKDQKASVFKENYLSEEFINFKEKVTESNWEPNYLLNKKEVLILATGPSTKKYKSALENYIKKFKPFVIALNTASLIDDKLIDMRAACHPLRIVTDIDKYNSMKQPLVCPFSTFDENFSSRIDLRNVFDFGLLIKKNTFEFHEKFCIIPKPLVLLYAISIAISGKAKSIKLTGVDGYAPGDPRNEELNDFLEILFNLVPNSLEIKSLTPTCYRYLDKESVFGY